VPVPATNMSTLPAVSFQISGPMYKWTARIYRAIFSETYFSPIHDLDQKINVNHY
jgi:hypothetical protein